MKIILFLFSQLLLSLNLQAAENKNNFFVDEVLNKIQESEKITAYYKFKSYAKDTPQLLAQNAVVLKKISEYSQQKWTQVEFGDWYLTDEKIINKYFILSQLLTLKSRQDKNIQPLLWGFEMVEQWLKSPKAFISLRLGGTIRSLLFDELETHNEYFVAAPLIAAHFFENYQVYPNIKLLLDSEAQALFKPLIVSPVADAYKSFGPFTVELIQKHKNVLDKKALEKQKNLALVYIEERVKKEPYTSVIDIVSPLAKEQVQQMQSQMGRGFYFLEALGGVALSDNSVMLQNKIQRLTRPQKDLLREKWNKMKNPLGQLYYALLLNHWEHLWNQQDIVLYKTDMSRLNMIKTKLAVQIYKNKFKQTPQKLMDLINTQILKSTPYDYFSGKPLQFSAQSQIWSVGENAQDDGGAGDDLTLSLTPRL